MTNGDGHRPKGLPLQGWEEEFVLQWLDTLPPRDLYRLAFWFMEELALRDIAGDADDRLAVIAAILMRKAYFDAEVARDNSPPDPADMVRRGLFADEEDAQSWLDHPK